MKTTLALVTDLYYKAKGRDYFREDLHLGELLRKEFTLVTVHLDDLDAISSHVDAILLRNTGPKSAHEARLEHIQGPLFNDLSGKGDIQGKQHLLDLFAEGFPVIPTVDCLEEVHKLGPTAHYIVKPMDGCDSHGLQILQEEELLQLSPGGIVLQPAIDFDYEVSFYFIGNEFQYALYAPDPERRWELQQYSPKDRDVAFASRFIDWNTCARGIQRIDACRDKKGELLLMELEDYNPFLSLELLDDPVKNRFVRTLSEEIKDFILKRGRV